MQISYNPFRCLQDQKYISAAQLTAVSPVEHPESDILAAETDPAGLEVHPESGIIRVVALQLRLGLLHADVAELEEAEPDPAGVHRGDGRRFCTWLAATEGPPQFLIVIVDQPGTGSGHITRLGFSWWSR